MDSPWTPARATDTQKCIRAGGSTTTWRMWVMIPTTTRFLKCWGTGPSGIISRRKPSAGPGSWWWNGGDSPRNGCTLPCTPRTRARATPGEFDREAWDYWAELFRSRGLDPDVQIVHGNVKDNFWMMGETGPCGPCSELHVDLTPEGNTKGSLVNKDSDQCIEIWNLVFIQYNAESDGSMRNLPACHVDTGMGFERACSIMQCTDGFRDFSRKPSNYATDVFRPLFDRLEALSGRKYADVSGARVQESGGGGRHPSGGDCLPRDCRPSAHAQFFHSGRHSSRQQWP